ncbi:MAG: hypothetical protein Q9172_005347 [Xanthocarpia lactea]
MKAQRTAKHTQMSEGQLAMLWYSHIDPKRPTPAVQCLALPETDWDNHGYISTSEGCPPGWYYWTNPEALRIPTWVMPALEAAESKVRRVFDIAFLLFKSKGLEWQESFNRVAQAKRYRSFSLEILAPKDLVATIAELSKTVMENSHLFLTAQ